MVTELRKTGIAAIGEVPWGAHFCHFYQSLDDLLGVLIPYLKTGLENHEFCLWVVSEPFSVDSACAALKQHLPEMARYQSAGSLEVISQSEWYLKENRFERQGVLNAWQERLAWARANGYAGMRVTGDESWVTEREWEAFSAYEQELECWVAGQPVFVLCTCSLARVSAGRFFAVAQKHSYVLARRLGIWEMIETPELKRAKGEVNRLNGELESKLVERSRLLAGMNDDLKREMAERRRAEKALRESNERFRRYFELGLIGMVITSPTKNWQEVNDKVCEILGYDRNELTRMTWTQLTHPDDLEADLANFNRVLAGEIDGYSMDKRFIRKDGKIIYATISVKCLRRANGSVDYFVALLQDITERRRAQEEIAFQASLLNQVRNAVIATDFNGRIVYWNKFAEQVYQWKADEVLGKSILEVTVPPESLDAGRGILANLASAGFWEGQLFVRRKDGITFPIHVVNTVYRDAEDQPKGIIGVSIDVTERQMAEDALRATGIELRALSASLNSAREEERARISRELHDELGAALTSLKWELARIDKPDSDTGGVPTSSARRHKIESMKELVDLTINTVRRISSELRPTILDDLGLVAALEWQAKQFETRTGIHCQLDVSTEEVDLNREQITAVFRIFQEALTNILRHAQATKIQIRINRENNEFRLEVIDDGRGISEEQKTGVQSLGLIGMRERAHLVGGKIEIIGVPGQGTTLSLRVPIRDGEAR